MDYPGTTTSGPVFASSRIIRWNELNDEEKDKYARFFAENNISFFKDVDGSYAANVRLYDSSVIDGSQKFGKQKNDGKNSSNGNNNNSSSRLIQPLAPGTAALFDYTEYRKFCNLISGADTIRPKERNLAWLMRYIEEIYDTRYAKDTQELKEGEEGGSGDGSNNPTPFPTFVVEFFTKRYGLRSLIDQSCWDLLYNIHRFRKENIEVEVFARFLEEMYDPDDLLFFLYVRSVVAKELNYNFRARWSEMGRSAVPSSPTKSATHGSENLLPGTSLSLSFRDCSLVSRVVFGSEADALYKTFMTMIERHMAGKKGTKTDGRRIDVGAFLHLAVVEYHETRPAEETGNDNDADRLYREAAAAYDDRIRTDSSINVANNSGNSAGPRPSSALLEAIGEAMHRANETYLDNALRSALSLPKEVQAQIRTEVSSQLESKVDSVLSAAITVSQSGNSSGNAEIDALATKFTQLITNGITNGNDNSINAFCDNALNSSEIKKTVEPLVNLLVQYAASRLKEATGGGK